MIGTLTLDVEDWDHANFTQLKGKDVNISSSVRTHRYAMDSNIDSWMSLLAEAGAKSTCFVLGEFALRFPDAVRNLARAGHEIASHGHTHQLIYEMSREQFRENLKRGLGTVGDLTGQRLRGFRAPSWSVDNSTPWFCEELADQNLIYDSSIFPMKLPFLSRDHLKTRPYWESNILRIPVTMWLKWKFQVPFSSGIFFRFTPLRMIELGLRRASAHRLPVMIVLHPRELDPKHPRLPLSGIARALHYGNLHSTLTKLRALLKKGQWTTISDLYRSQLENPGRIQE